MRVIDAKISVIYIIPLGIGIFTPKLISDSTMLTSYEKMITLTSPQYLIKGFVMTSERKVPTIIQTICAVLE